MGERILRNFKLSDELSQAQQEQFNADLVTFSTWLRLFLNYDGLPGSLHQPFPKIPRPDLYQRLTELVDPARSAEGGVTLGWPTPDLNEGLVMDTQVRTLFTLNKTPQGGFNGEARLDRIGPNSTHLGSFKFNVSGGTIETALEFEGKEFNFNLKIGDRVTLEKLQALNLIRGFICAYIDRDSLTIPPNLGKFFGI